MVLHKTDRINNLYRNKVIQYALVMIVVIWTLYPFYSMFVASMKNVGELYNLEANPFWINKPTLSNFIYLFTQTNYLKWYINSSIVGISTVLISTIISLLFAYSVAVLRTKGGLALGVMIFMVYLIPQTLLFLPLNSLVNSLGISDSLWSLIFTYPTFQIPFSTWLLIGYFQNIPKEMIEAARVDGASTIQILRKIVIPISSPILITVMLFSFVLSWGDLIYALVFISSSTRETLGVGTVTQLIRGDSFFWGPLMAGGLLAAIPVVILFSFFLDQYVSGITSGSVK